jgi:hypothetical protein
MESQIISDNIRQLAQLIDNESIELGESPALLLANC